MELVAEGDLDIHSFPFRYSCYSEFHWTPQQVASLTEPEAMKLAVMFQEKSRHERRQMKKSESPSSSDPSRSGFVEEFSFGAE